MSLISHSLRGQRVRMIRNHATKLTPSIIHITSRTIYTAAASSEKQCRHYRFAQSLRSSNRITSHRFIHTSELAQSLHQVNAPIPITVDQATNSSVSQPGVFGIPELSDPTHLESFAYHSRITCDRLLEQIEEEYTSIKHTVDELNGLPPNPEILNQLITRSNNILFMIDSISDALCRCVDTAELIRNIQPVTHNNHSINHQWRESAEKIVVELSEYMESLNQHVGLHRTIKYLLHNPSISQSLNDEQIRVANHFVLEMDMKGIDQPSKQRQAIAEIQSMIVQCQHAFTNNVMNQSHNQSDRADISPASAIMNYLPRSVQQTIKVSNNVASIPTDTDTINALLRYCTDESILKQIYLAGTKSCSINQPILQHLVSYRHQLALALGYQSFASLHTATLVSQSSEFVDQFLLKLLMALQPAGRHELETLKQFKQSINQSEIQSVFNKVKQSLTNNSISQSSNQSIKIAAWELPGLLSHAKSALYDLNASEIESYFSLKNCLNGLDQICQSLFGVTVKRAAFNPREDWLHAVKTKHPDESIKVELIDTTTGELKGIVYFDLFAREGKFRGGASFVIQSTRSIQQSNNLPPVRQLPVMMVCSSFNRPRSINQSILLSINQVETLFHEFGHVLHHTLCETQYQHLSGARGELDFVELPSILFESFLYDYRVLQKFAYHYQNGQVIPESLVNKLVESRRGFYAIETTTQTILALFDQRLFGRDAPSFVQNADAIERMLSDIQYQYGVVPHVPRSRPYLTNTHLCHYGAGYYTYLMCRVYAAAVWNRLFQADPLNREAGRTYHAQVLLHGGAKPPRMILRELLGDDVNLPIQQFIEQFTKTK